MDLKEEIFYSNGEIDSSKLNSFFDLLVKRKKDDVDNFGLQGSMIIRSNDFAAKVNENDGRDSHNLTFANLYQYMNGDYDYFSNTKQVSDDYIKRMNSESVKVRIISCDDYLKVVCIGSIDEDKVSPYHFRVLREVVDICNDLKNMKCYDRIDLGLLVNGLFYFEFIDFSNDDYNLMCNRLDREIETINENMKK